MERKLIQELAKRSTDEDSVIDWRWGAGKNGCWLHLDVGKIMGPVTCGEKLGRKDDGSVLFISKCRGLKL